MTTDLYDYFCRGSEYPEERTSGEVRAVPCPTCAFGPPPTVRPADVSVFELREFTSDMDDFLCHTPGSSGCYDTCALWAACKEKTT